MKQVSFFYIAIWFISASVVAQAQSDSARMEYKTEDETISRTEIQRLFRYLTRANVEETTLIKIGGLPNSVSFSQDRISVSGGIKTDISIERKVLPSISMLFGFDSKLSAMRFSKAPGTPSSAIYDYRSSALSSSAKVAVRYYYSMARRIKQGRTASNLSGTYLSIQADRPVLDCFRDRQYDAGSGDFQTQTIKQPLWSLDQSSYSLLWGIQQRLGRRGYVDLNAGPTLTIYGSATNYYAYTNSQRSFSLRFNAVIGLGW